MIGAKWYDMVVGVDIHWVLVPAPPAPPIPTPLPHPFTGMIFDPIGLAISTAMSAGISAYTGSFSGPVFINNMPAANTGTDATNMLVMPHFPTPPGIMWAPVPAGLKPPIPGKAPDPGIPSPVPSNDATMITGSKTVYIGGTNACRLGDLAMSCGEPVRLPSSTIIAVPMGPPVLIGGPPALDFIAAATSMIRSQWVSGRLHQVLKAEPGSWKSKLICFLTGHPVDVMSGMVLTEAEDISLPGPIPFQMTRTYYSRSDYEGPLGVGWTHSYDQFIRREPDRLVLHYGDGRDLYFYETQPGRVTRNHVERMDLGFGEGEIWVDTPDKHRLVFAHRNRSDGSWPLVRVENRAGNSIEMEYDQNGFLTKAIDSCGRHIGFENDASGRLVRVLLPDPENEDKTFVAMSYSIDDEGDLVAATDALDHKFLYYYKYHLLVRETDRNGLSFYFAYDGIDNDAWCVRTWGDNGIYDHVLTYDKQKRVTVVEDSLGHPKAYMGNEAGLVEKVVDALGGETLYEWDQYYRKTAETDANGNCTRWQYDDRGNLILETRPDGATVEAVYDKGDNRINLTDPNGNSWCWNFDSSSRIVLQENPLGEVTRYEYDHYGMTTLIDPSGGHTTMEFDDQGNMVLMTTPDGAAARWQYDLLGRSSSVEDAMGNQQTRRWDLVGNILELNQPDGNRCRYQYNPEGYLIRSQNSYGETHYRYSGYCMTSRESEGVVRSFSFDSEERLIGVRNEQGDEFHLTRNETGHIVEEAGFDGVSRQYERDKGGRVVKARRSGRETEYTYDAMSRLISMKHEDGFLESFSWRSDGLLTAASNQHSNIEFERDALGRIIREKQADAWIENGYDHLGLPVHIRSSMGADQHIKRNTRGDSVSMSFANQEHQWNVDFGRNALGFEISRRLGPIKGSFERDSLGRVVKHRVEVGHQIVHGTDYNWGIEHRLMESRDLEQGTTRYLHDGFGQLSRSDHQGEIVWRNPDSYGNIYGDAGREDRRYGPGGRLLETRTGSGDLKLEYDGEGHIIVRENGVETWQYQWDGAGRLRTIQRPDGQEINYLYDPLGRRIARTFGGKTTRWLWRDDTMLHQWEDEGDNVITWLHEPESHTPLARFEKDGDGLFITDYLGNPVMLLDREGQTLWKGSLDINGQVHEEGNSQYCPFRFPGQHYDSDSQLSYNRFRYYDPQTGLYISPDPIGLAGGINPYAYVFDSLYFIDPLGLDWNYQLRDSSGNVYYSGRASDNTTPAEVMRRHGNTTGADGARFTRGVDQFEQITPPGTPKNAVRGIEELGVLARGEDALLGRGAADVRGNKIHGVSLTSNNRTTYMAAAQAFLAGEGADSVDDLRVRVCS